MRIREEVFREIRKRIAPHSNATQVFSRRSIAENIPHKCARYLVTVSKVKLHGRGGKKMICTKCGTDNKSHAKFCYKCGAPFQVRQDEYPQEVDGLGIYDPGIYDPNASAPGVPSASNPNASAPDIYKPGIPNVPAPGIYDPGIYNPVPGFGAPGAGIPLYDAGVPLPSRPKPKKALALLIIIAVVAVLAVVAILYVLNSYTKAPRNVMAALYDGFNNLLASEGFDISTTYTMWNNEDSQTTRQNISVLFGEDTASSVFELSQQTPMGWNNVAFTGDRFIAGAWYDYSYFFGWDNRELQPGNMNDPSNYWAYEMSGSELRDLFEEAEDFMFDEYDVSVNINALVQDHRLNIEEFIRIGNEIADSSNKDLEYALDELGISSIPDIEEMRSVFEYFVYEKCEEKGFVEKFISDAEISEDSFEFTLNIGVLIEAFEDFLYELEDDEKALSQIDVEKSTVRTMRRIYRLATRELQRNLDWDEFTESIFYKVGMQLDENRVLKTLNADVEIDYKGDFYRLESLMEVTMVNDSKIDIKALNEFADKIINQYGDDGDIWGGFGLGLDPFSFISAILP